jgi:AcrR family transcriptional regulator
MRIDGGNANGRATRERLVILAERMFADRGIEAVSLRAIGQAAGQRNNNVVQYHFGDRANLVASIYAFRSEPLNARRYELLEQHRDTGAPDDVRALLHILLQPHAESIPDPGNQFLGFLARLVLDSGSMASEGAVGAAPFMGAHQELRERVRTANDSTPTDVFDRRFDLLFDFAIIALAATKRSPQADHDALDEVVEIMAAGLAAPVSASATRSSR